MKVDIIQELSDVICNCLMRSGLCEDSNCDKCIYDNSKLVVGFLEDVVNEKI